MRISVKQCADQPAVEIAGAEQRVANGKGEIEIPRLHETEHAKDIVYDLSPAHRAALPLAEEFGREREQIRLQRTVPI